MTLKRLMILLGILAVLAGGGIMWLWQVAYSPQGRARVIIAQLKGDTTTLRGWMLQHHLIRPGFSVPPKPPGWEYRNPGPFFSDQQMAAVDAMARLGPDALPVVFEGLRDEQSEVRLMSIRTCGWLHDPTAITPLVTCMDEDRHRPSYTRHRYDISSYAVQSLCVKSLIQTGPEAVPALLKIMKDDEVGSWQRISAAGGLTRMGRDEGRRYLLAALESPLSTNRAEAGQELCENQVGGTLEPVLTLISDHNSDVRNQVARAVAERKDPSVIPTVRKLLNHPDPGVRYEAAYVLGELHDRGAIPAFRNLLDDPDAGVRYMADLSLDKLGAKPPPASQPGKP